MIERKKRDKVEDVEMKVPPVVEEFWAKILETLKTKRRNPYGTS